MQLKTSERQRLLRDGYTVFATQNDIWGYHKIEKHFCDKCMFETEHEIIIIKSFDITSPRVFCNACVEKETVTQSKKENYFVYGLPASLKGKKLSNVRNCQQVIQLTKYINDFSKNFENGIGVNIVGSQSGQGKTHCLVGLVKIIAVQNPEKNIVFVKAEDLLNRNFLPDQKADVLAIDGLGNTNLTPSNYGKIYKILSEMIDDKVLILTSGTFGALNAGNKAVKNRITNFNKNILIDFSTEIFNNTRWD